MTNTKFDKLIGLLEPLETDSVGEWIIDKEHKGNEEDDPIHFPYPKYTEVVNELIDAVYKFEDENPEYELTKYGELLKERGLEWGRTLNGECRCFQYGCARYHGVTYGHGASREIL